MITVSNIINFKEEWQVKLFIKSRALKEVGAGSEGTCYLGKDGKVYKLLEFEHAEPYVASDVVTEEEAKYDSFAFPDELYAVNNKLKGYRTRRVRQDYFAGDNIFDFENIATLNLAAVSHAYKRMLLDIVGLSNQRILIFDLPFNIMFDGSTFTAIDTCGYKKVDYDPLVENLKSLNMAMENLFRLWFQSYQEFDEKVHRTDIDEFLTRVANRIPPELKRNQYDNSRDDDVHYSR